MHSYGVTLAHSAKGSEWKEHKYIRKKNGTYYYLDENGNETTTTHKEGSNSKSESSDKKDDKASSEKKEDDKDVSAEAKKIIDSNIKAEDLTAENVEKLAKEVIRGGFGNGQERKDLLGEHYAVIQKRVNELMKGYASKPSDKKDDKKPASKKTTEDNKKKKTNKSKKKSSDTVKHDGLYNGSLYIIHAGKGHDDNPPGRGSGRYAYGSGSRPHQHDNKKKIKAFAETALTRNIKAGKNNPPTSNAERISKEAINKIERDKTFFKSVMNIKHWKERDRAYKEAMENVNSMTDQELRQVVNRKNLEKQYISTISDVDISLGEQRVLDVLDVAGDIVGTVGGSLAILATAYGLKHR